LSRGEKHLNLTPAAHRAVAAPPRHIVEHLLGNRASCAGLKGENRPSAGIGP
jgi:hypothetical protein